jgi:hypothetical protein
MTTWTYQNTNTGRYGSQQTFTSPGTGWYRIIARGAAGGGEGRGLGAEMSGWFLLSANATVSMRVGHRGSDVNRWGSTNRYLENCGGGGGTFVLLGNADAESKILLIAGGGAGNPGDPLTASRHGQITPLSVGATVAGAGGGIPSAGGGFNTDGQSDVLLRQGAGFLNGSTGGRGEWYYHDPNYPESHSNGGYGGGAGGMFYDPTDDKQGTGPGYRGGGGGYTGGGSDCGGGSIVGTEATWAISDTCTAGFWDDHGRVVITDMQPPANCAGRVMLLASAQPRVVIFDWLKPSIHLPAETSSSGEWSATVPTGTRFGVYYLSSDSRCPPIINGP